jgi:hypothetical protein
VKFEYKIVFYRAMSTHLFWPMLNWPLSELQLRSPTQLALPTIMKSPSLEKSRSIHESDPTHESGPIWMAPLMFIQALKPSQLWRDNGALVREALMT